jgi:hypothetical protein
MSDQTTAPSPTSADTNPAQNILGYFPAETIRERFDRHAAYFRTVAEHLTDLSPTVGERGLKVGAVSAWIDGERTERVGLSTGRYRTRRHQGRRYYQKTDAKHVAAAIRKLAAEDTVEAEQRRVHAEAQAALYAREEQAKAPVAELVEDINLRTCEAGLGRFVHKLEVSEHRDGEPAGPEYRFSLELEGLSEWAVRHVLSAVKIEAIQRAAAVAAGGYTDDPAAGGPSCNLCGVRYATERDRSGLTHTCQARCSARTDRGPCTPFATGGTVCEFCQQPLTGNGRTR